MRNKIYAIKSDPENPSNAFFLAIVKALKTVEEGKASNVKIFLSHSDLLESDLLSEALNQIFPGKGEDLRSALKRDRRFPIVDFPNKGASTGVQAILINNNITFPSDDTTAVLIYSNLESLKKLESALFYTTIELIAVLNQYVEEDLKILLSATNATEAFNSKAVFEVYDQNALSEEALSIISRLIGIDINALASNHYTRDAMNSVINELVDKRIVVSYQDFLGFLINRVKYNPKESMALLNWKSKYFGR